tara:strand:+ start:1494 stop:1778 length:285 start_codon:yes stop_codon:yes gene_type:complete
MNRLPIEIENKIWGLYYSHIHYTNVILEFQKRITMCNKIVTNEIKDNSTLISMLEFYSEQLSKIYENDELKQRLFQISFYNSNVGFYNPIFMNR